MSVLLAKQKDIWYMYFFKTEKSLMLVHFQNGKMSDVGTFFKTEKCLMSVLFAKRENLWCRYFLQKPLMSVLFAKHKNVSTLPAPAPPAAAGYRLDLWGGGRTSPPGECLRCHQTGPTNSNSQHPFPIQTFHTIANSLGICKDFASEIEKGYSAYLTLSWCRVADRFLNTGFLQEWLWGR